MAESPSSLLRYVKTITLACAVCVHVTSYLIAFLTGDEHRALLPVVHVQLLVRERWVVHATELTPKGDILLRTLRTLLTLDAPPGTRGTQGIARHIFLVLAHRVVHTLRGEIRRRNSVAEESSAAHTAKQTNSSKRANAPRAQKTRKGSKADAAVTVISRFLDGHSNLNAIWIRENRSQLNGAQERTVPPTSQS